MFVTQPPPEYYLSALSIPSFTAQGGQTLILSLAKISGRKSSRPGRGQRERDGAGGGGLAISGLAIGARGAALRYAARRLPIGPETSQKRSAARRLAAQKPTPRLTLMCSWLDAALLVSSDKGQVTMP